MRKIILALVAILVITIALPASAQDGGLSEEEQALLDRVLEAEAEITNSDAYTAVSVENFTLDFVVLDGETTVLERTDITLIEEEIAYLYDAETDTDNEVRMVTVSYEFSDNFNNGGSYVMVGEGRQVEGVLYANFAYEASEGDVDPLPDGWVIVDETSLDLFPGLTEADLDDWLESITEEDDAEDPLDAIFSENTIAATSTTTTEDGVEVETIVLTVSAEGIASIFAEGEEDAGPLAGFLDNIQANDTDFTFRFEDGQLVSRISALSFTLTGIPGTAISADFPETWVIDYSYLIEETQTLLSFDSPTEPATAPDIAQ